MANGEIRIRNRATGETFIGKGQVPEGYDLIGPASEPKPAPGPTGDDILAQNIKSAGRQTTAFHELAAMGRAAGPSVLPTAGGMAGSVVGPAGTVAGSILGEGANQALGITEPSLASVLLAGGAPAVGAGVGAAAGALKGAIARRLPGAAPVLHELAGEAVGRIPAKIPIIPEADLAKLRVAFPQLGPQVGKDELYTLVNQFNPKVQMPNLVQKAGDLLTKEQQAAAGLKLPGVSTTAESLRTTAGQAIPGGGVPFQDVRVNLRRIGDKIRETREAGGEEHGAWKALQKSLWDDLEAAAAQGNPAMPAVQALKAANLAAKREFAVDEIAHVMSLKGGGISLRPDLAAMPNGEPQIQVNLRKIITAIEKSDDLKRSLGKAELHQMTQELAQIARSVSALPPPAGVNVGSFRMLRATGGLAGAGTAAGGLLMGPGGAAIGGGIGAATGAFGPMILAKLMVTPTGRAFLGRTLTQSGGVLSADALAILGSAVGTSETGREVTGGAVQIGRDLFAGQD